MEVLHDAKYNLIETDNLVVKNQIYYTITSNTKLTNNDSGSLYLINNLNNNIKITLPFVETGIFYEFLFTNNSDFSIEFTTCDIPLDNSKIIGTDWLYLKRSYIDLNYSIVNGSTITFTKTEKGEYIKFFSDGSNFYIISKNDTNNNINNIIYNYPNNLNNNIININLLDGNYKFDIINEITNTNTPDLYVNNIYYFKFDTTSPIYNNITSISSTLIYKLYTYIDYYDYVELDLNNNNVNHKYKYPVLNYNLIDNNNNIVKDIEINNTNYIIDLYNNSIITPTFLFNNTISNNIDSNFGMLLSNINILNIQYSNNNLLIYDQDNNILYDHNNARSFILINRDIKYTINLNGFTFNISNNLYNTIYHNYGFFKMSSLNTNDDNTLFLNATNIVDYVEVNNFYYLHLKLTNDKIFILPLLFLDILTLETISNSSIVFQNKLPNMLPKVNNVINYNYKFNINLDTITSNFTLKFLNTTQSTSNIFENIFNLITKQLNVPLVYNDINNKLLLFKDNNNKIVDTNIIDDGIYKIYKLDLSNLESDITSIVYYSKYNIIGNTFNINYFTIDDNLSGKVILFDLTNNININFNNLKEGNSFKFIIDIDNTIDTNKYILKKNLNSSGIEEYYFINTNNTTELFKNITLYTNNLYEIVLDTSINRNEVKFLNLFDNDNILFGNIEDEYNHFKKISKYSFITKKLNNDNTISYIINLNNFNYKSKTLYIYNKFIKNIFCSISIQSHITKLNNIFITSKYPFNLLFGEFSNNISYIKNYDTYTLIFKNAQKGDFYDFYFQNNKININTNLINKKYNINYNNIFNNNYKIKFEKTDLSYNINLFDDYNNIINYLSNTILYKNINYYFSNEHISNYTLNNTIYNDIYLKINNSNNTYNFDFYSDSQFINKINNLIIYRKNTYYFNQYHRTNFNPFIDIDLKNIFKVSYKNNCFYVNNMKLYEINILKNTTYYFDLTDVLIYNFNLSLYNDGINNNTYDFYNNSNEIKFNFVNINNTNYCNLIILKLNDTNPNTKLYYFSPIIKNIGGIINVVDGSLNYNLKIKQVKYDNPDLIYYPHKSYPKYNLEISNINNTEQYNNITFIKNLLYANLSLNFKYDTSIYNKHYTNTNFDVDNEINIYVSLAYNENFPLLSSFEFYNDISFTQKITLPITLLKNKIYNFIQPDYDKQIFKFFIYINSLCSNEYHNIVTQNTYDISIISYVTGEGFKLDTNTFYNDYIYYSGIYYNDTNLLDTTTDLSTLPNYSKLINTYKIFIVHDKTIFINDTINNINNTSNILNLTNPEYINSFGIDITQYDLYQYNILNNDLTYLYLTNTYNSTTNVIYLNIALTQNSSYNYIEYYKTDNFYIPTITGSPYNNISFKKNKDIYINYLHNYNINFNNLDYNLAYIDNNTIYNNDNYIISINHTEPLVYFVYSKNIEPIYNYPIRKVNVTNIDNIYFINNISQDTINYFNSYYIYFDLSNLTPQQQTDFKISKTQDGTHTTGGVEYTTTLNNNILEFYTTENNTFYYYSQTNPNAGGTINITQPTLHFKNFKNTLNNTIDDTSNFYNINYDFDLYIYEYFIRLKNIVNSFDIEFNLPTNFTLFSINISNNDNINTYHLNSSANFTIDTSNITFLYMDIQLLNNTTNNIDIYRYIILKEDLTLYKYIVDYGKLYINNIDYNNVHKVDIFKSKPIKFNLSDTSNPNLPNDNLIQKYYIELLATQYYDEAITVEETNKFFNININTYDNSSNQDTILEKNIISSNLTVSDFRTIYFDTSHPSLTNKNITFYTNAQATIKLENNISYIGKFGTPNSYIIINMNPTLHSTLFYYDDPIYISSLKYDIIIKKNNIVNITTETFNYGSVNKLKLNFNIIPFLYNTIDINYHTILDLDISYINIDKCYFILYNDNNIYNGTIYVDPIDLTSTNTNLNNIDYKNNIYLVFDELIFTSDYIIIDKTYKLKIFNHKGGQIITPNILEINKIYNLSTLNTIYTSQNINIYNKYTYDIFTYNNKVIDNYINFIISSNEKLYISSKNTNKLLINNNNIVSQNYSSDNYNITNIDSSNSTIINIINNASIYADTSLENTFYNNRFINKHQYIDINEDNNTYVHSKNQDKFINSFDILSKLYKTVNMNETNYYSIISNINGHDDTILILKPYQLYTFNMLDIIYKINSDIYDLIYISNSNTYLPKLSIVNSDETKELVSSLSGSLDFTISDNTTIFTNNYNKLYLKITFSIKNRTDNTLLNQGYYIRNKDIIDTFYESTTFCHYVPLVIDLKSTININVLYNNNNFYFNKYINKLYLYNFYTIIFDLSNINNIRFDILDNDNTLLFYKKYNKIIFYPRNINKLSLFTENSNNINIDSSIISSELIASNSSKVNLFLYNKYNGNDSSNDTSYKIKYIGTPGIDGSLIYNYNNSFDYSISTFNNNKDLLHIYYNTYFNNNITLSNYINTYFNSSFITLFEPIQIKFDTIVNNGSNITYSNIDYNINTVPGQDDSNFTFIYTDNSNITLNNVKLSAIGYYSKKTIDYINSFNILFNIYTLPFKSINVHITLNKNIIIQLPYISKDYVYFNFTIDNTSEYNLSLITNNSIYINTLYDNINVINNNIIELYNLKKNDTFTIYSNNNIYNLSNVNINTNKYILNNYNNNKPDNINILVDVNLDKYYFSFNVIKQFYNYINYNLNLSELRNTNLFLLTNTIYYFKIHFKHINNYTNFNINTYNKIYNFISYSYITQNDISSTFNTFISNNNKHYINFDIKYDPNNNIILFNNKSIEPILYSNYIYNFNISNIKGFYILKNNDNTNINYNINTSDFVTLTTNANEINLLINNFIYHNSTYSSNYLNNINKLSYIYYIPLTINNNVDRLIINEFISGSSSIDTKQISIYITSGYFNTYNFSINDNILTNQLVTIINTLLEPHNYTFYIQNNSFVIENLNVDFSLTETTLSKLLGFTDYSSVKTKHNGIINTVSNNFTINEYYKYFSRKLSLNYYNFKNNNNNIIINLNDTQYYVLPDINNNNITYNIQINNSNTNKELYIISNHIVYNINNNTYGNIIKIIPNTSNNIKFKSLITISSSDNDYTIEKYTSIDYINIYNINIYNNYSNIRNFDLSINLDLIKQYISVFDIHIITLLSKQDYTKHELFTIENKFLHIAKTLAKLLDPQEKANLNNLLNFNISSSDIIDNNIINTISDWNSVIILYDNTSLFNTFNSNKHTNNLYINLNDININYDFNSIIKSNNIYDKTLDKLFDLILSAYINTYPHIFDYTTTSSSINVYKSIMNSPIIYLNNYNSFITIIDNALTENKNNIDINNTFYSNKSIYNDYMNISNNMSILVHNLKTVYTNKHNIISSDIQIINLDKGFKNNEHIYIKINDTTFIDIKLKSNFYNIYDSHKQSTTSHLLDYNFYTNYLIENNSFHINYTNTSILSNDLSSIITNYNLNVSEPFYSHSLNNSSDNILYIKNLLFGLLGLYKNIWTNTFFNTLFYNNNIIDNLLYYPIHSKLFSYNLILKLNPDFVALYFNSSLSNIKTFNNIFKYNLQNIGYKLSNISKLSNINLYNGITSIDFNFNPHIFTYHNILFNNYIKFFITPYIQYTNLTFNAYYINSSDNTIILNVIQDKPFEYIIDTSTINSSSIDIIIEIHSQSEDKKNTSIYKFNCKYNDITYLDNSINIISTKYYNNSIIQTINNINNTNIIYDLTIDNDINKHINIYKNNIYSTIVLSNITKTILKDNNLLTEVNFNDFKNDTQLVISSTLNSNTDIYKINLYIQKNNIALLDNITFTNIIHPIIFNKYKFYYSSHININNPFYITINKSDILSNNIISLHIYIDKYYLYHIYTNNFNYIEIQDSIIVDITNNSNFTKDHIQHIKVISTVTSESNLYSNFYQYILFNKNFSI